MQPTVTVCELPDDPAAFADARVALQDHVIDSSTDRRVLNESPFDAWFAREPEFEASTWRRAVERHRRGVEDLRFECTVIATMPVDHEGRRHQRSFSWSPASRLEPWRFKSYLPDELDVWEASWYEPVSDEPDLRQLTGAQVGVLVCSELWKFERAGRMGRLGAQLIATPRATGTDSVDKWLTGGRAAAISAGAFSLSSNLAGGPFGGHGWIISPDGEILAETDEGSPFATVTIDLADADRAKATYPRYALWRS